MRRLLILCAAALALAGATGGCGGDDPADGREPKPPAGSDLGPYGVDELSRDQIERFGRLTLPASTANLHSEHVEVGPDEAVLVSFDMDAAGLADLKAQFSQPLQPAMNPFAAAQKVDPRLGWKPDQAERPLGLNEVLDQGFARMVLVDRADPARPRVYLSLSTL